MAEKRISFDLYSNHAVLRPVNEAGYTLAEVLTALVIIGIILSFALPLYTDQWRIAREVTDRMEAHFAVLNAGRTVSDAIRQAKTVEWDNSGTLRILPLNQGIRQDYYYKYKSILILLGLSLPNSRFYQTFFDSMIK
ncbi:type II secretion system protein [Desulfitobacterium sp. AusDCA]|uniref:type II secretion system protein n=1 Tax=Desulfitobacterium sp. AusDCA TaxID=3240383 RepID=UPI003DA7553D